MGLYLGLRQVTTRTRPGDVVYTVANDDMPPPYQLIAGEGLSCFPNSTQAGTALLKAGMPYPVGRYRISKEALIGQHDTQEFTPEDGVRYRASGFGLVELPDGELRLLTRDLLTPLPPNPLSPPQTQNPLLNAARLSKGGYAWGRKIIDAHLRSRHGHVAPDEQSEETLHTWHADQHRRFGERLDHPHKGGVLALRKSETMDLLHKGDLKRIGCAGGCGKKVTVAPYMGKYPTERRCDGCTIKKSHPAYASPADVEHRDRWGKTSFRCNGCKQYVNEADESKKLGTCQNCADGETVKSIRNGSLAKGMFSSREPMDVPMSMEDRTAEVAGRLRATLAKTQPRRAARPKKTPKLGTPGITKPPAEEGAAFHPFPARKSMSEPLPVGVDPKRMAELRAKLQRHAGVMARYADPKLQRQTPLAKGYSNRMMGGKNGPKAPQTVMVNGRAVEVKRSPYGYGNRAPLDPDRAKNGIGMLRPNPAELESPGTEDRAKLRRDIGDPVDAYTGRQAPPDVKPRAYERDGSPLQDEAYRRKQLGTRNFTPGNVRPRTKPKFDSAPPKGTRLPDEGGVVRPRSAPGRPLAPRPGLTSKRMVQQAPLEVGHNPQFSDEVKGAYDLPNPGNGLVNPALPDPPEGVPVTNGKPRPVMDRAMIANPQPQPGAAVPLRSSAEIYGSAKGQGQKLSPAQQREMTRQMSTQQQREAYRAKKAAERDKKLKRSYGGSIYDALCK